MHTHRRHAWLAAAAGAALTAALALTLAAPGPSSAGTLKAAAATAGKRATAVLATLKTAPARSMHGYSRTRFGAAWTDNNTAPLGHNGCDTRDDILRRDLTHTTFATGSSCTIATGILHDPYLGEIIDFTRGVGTSDAVQIDHVVALGDAWRTGAARWTAARRTELANDPLNLLAVNEYSNESKGDDDAAQWLPRKSFRCEYVATQIAVKARYRLSVTAAERHAMVKVLRACPGQRVPTEASRDRLPEVGAPATTGPTPTSTTPALTRSPTPTPTPPPTASTSTATTVVPPPVATTTSYAPLPRYGVHPGAFCAPAGALGYTSAGTLMICGPASDGRNRWHAA